MIILSLSWQLASQGFVLFRVLGMDTTAKRQNHFPLEFFLEMTQLHLEFRSPRRVCHTRCSLVGLHDDEYKCPYAKHACKRMWQSSWGNASYQVSSCSDGIYIYVCIYIYIYVYVYQNLIKICVFLLQAMWPHKEANSIPTTHQADSPFKVSSEKVQTSVCNTALCTRQLCSCGSQARQAGRSHLRVMVSISLKFTQGCLQRNPSCKQPDARHPSESKYNKYTMIHLQSQFCSSRTSACLHDNVSYFFNSPQWHLQRSKSKPAHKQPLCDMFIYIIDQFLVLFYLRLDDLKTSTGIPGLCTRCLSLLWLLCYRYLEGPCCIHHSTLRIRPRFWRHLETREKTKASSFPVVEPHAAAGLLFLPGSPEQIATGGAGP